ncbi:Uma2 family endonuclease [Streptomyces sp. NBC_00006]|uniref:Uma2 family endonuclease n=1 Tax=Streptomyces sp. NBC_00006 TaxID=2975619 RepID=UPI002250C46D|nr:Uma2 family endonuclease [Streptomyces sp. NBC_00006]MCX5532133.1 Uma2 family endonuclease [Streptomyces sp. NBC_00006]
MKTLANHLPYGQAAMRTALNNLHRAGHLRRGREHVQGSGSARWVTRTWFSRTARGDTWWTAYVRGDVPETGRDAPPEEPPPRPTRSRALLLLTALGRTAPSLALSAAECDRLAPDVERWFERGATEDTLLHALTAGLPTPVHSPAALLRRRLTDKLPPPPPPPANRPVLRLIECAKCGTPGRPEALPGGFCTPCSGARPGQDEWASPDGVLMAVEVTSKDRDADRRDRQEKPRAYAYADIPVYLLVDRDNDTVVVHSSPENGVYQNRRPYHYGATVRLPAPVTITLETERLKDYA